MAGNSTDGPILELSYVSYIGCAIAALSCLFTGLVITGYRLVQSVRAYIRMNFLMMLASAEFVFLAFVQYTKVGAVCTIMASWVHFSVLGSFAWLLSYVLFLGDEVKGRKDQHALGVAIYTFLGWFVPITVVAISLIWHYQDYRSPHYCWVSEELSMQIIWEVPVVTLALVTLFLLIYVVIKYWRETSGDEKRKLQLAVALSGIRSCCMLLPALSATWLLASYAIRDRTMILQIMFTVANSILGLFVFLFMYLFNEQVIQARKSRGSGVKRVKYKPAERADSKALLPRFHATPAAAAITGDGDRGARYESEMEELPSRRNSQVSTTSQRPPLAQQEHTTELDDLAPVRASSPDSRTHLVDSPIKPPRRGRIKAANVNI